MSWICSCIQHIPGHGHREWFLASTQSFSSTFTFISGKERWVQTKCAEVGIKSLSFQQVLLLSPLFAVPSSSHSTKKPQTPPIFSVFLLVSFHFAAMGILQSKDCFLTRSLQNMTPTSTEQTTSKPVVFISDISFTSVKSKCQEQQGTDIPTKFPVKEMPPKPQPQPSNTPNSQFFPHAAWC